MERGKSNSKRRYAGRCNIKSITGTSKFENHLYILANKSKRYEIVNSNIPAEISISEMDRAEMDEFIDNMRLILGVLGHKILEPSIKSKNDEKEILYISQERSGIKASGKPISEGFAVLKGSIIADNVTTSLSKSVIDKRQALFDKGIIDENFTFTQDWAFTSPSLAAAKVGAGLGPWRVPRHCTKLERLWTEAGFLCEIEFGYGRLL